MRIVFKENQPCNPFKCDHCRKLDDGSMGPITAIADGTPIDGLYCCERCAEEAAKATVFVDAGFIAGLVALDREIQLRGRDAVLFPALKGGK